MMETETHKEIFAEKFVLVDSEGLPRAGLSVDDGGQAALHFLDRDGHGKLILGVGKDGQAVARLHHSSADSPFAQVQIDSAGDFRIVYYNTKGDNCFQLCVQADGSSATLLLGEGDSPPLMLAVIDGVGQVFANKRAINP